MFLIIGALVVIGVIYLLLKRHESRMVLIAAGILMCCIAGKPMASLDAFAKSMTNAGLITSVCSCMGFAWCMKYTGCDKHLVVAIGKVLKKMGFLLIPGATLATFVVNIYPQCCRLQCCGRRNFYSDYDVCRHSSGNGRSCR